MAVHYDDNNNNDNNTYITQIRKSSANAHVSAKQKCFQFVRERVQRDVCRLQIVWQAV